ncbi:MAG: peptidase U34 [Deltaproteobacteria bacterium]|nr:peptidase U34 [Deltaproteobacteria bacterium]
MCDTVVRVLPGKVLFAKNSDRDANEAQALCWEPAREHAAGEEVGCTWMAIPQARRTHAVLLSRPFWMWGAEIAANEHGVVVGNEAVFTRAPYARTGLTGMDLLRLAVERGASADEAVEVITSLLTRHGQGGGCGHEDRSFTYHNSFIVADRRGAFVVETAAREFVVERVEGARSISNGLTVDGFATHHSDWLYTAVSACRVRRQRTEELAARAGGPADMAAILRDHGGRPAPRYSPLNGCMDAPCAHGGGLATSTQTTASWVAELTPVGDRHFVTATAAPCTGLFKPVDVDAPLDLGPWPGDVFDARTPWWRHERLHRSVMRDPVRLLPLFAGERDVLEARFLREHTPPGEAFRLADEATARWTARVTEEAQADTRPVWTRAYWSRRNARARLPALSPGRKLGGIRR